LRELRKRKPQETQALALPIMVATASTEHTYWLARLLREIFRQQTQAPANSSI